MPANAVATPNGLLLKTTATQDCGPNFKWATASIWSNFKQKYGFFEARLKIGDISGLNNAFWMTTDDEVEIDAPEIHYPNQASTVLHKWNKQGKDASVGFRMTTKENLSLDFHDYGLLWTKDSLIYEIDGKAISAIAIHDSIATPAQIRFSSLLAGFAGQIPDDPAGHDMAVKYLRVYSLDQ